MHDAQPVMVIDLFPHERDQLLNLLAELTAEEWKKSTVCPGWSVKSIASHILGDDLGYLSRMRDHFSNPFFEDKDLHDWKHLVKNLNQANEQWVVTTANLSSRLLIDLLTWTGRQLHDYVCSLDLMVPGDIVSWAGPDPAPVWLDVAREYTERWVHQQQIRDAVDKPGLKERRFFHPVLDAFMRALPHTFRSIPIAEEILLKFIVTGEAGDVWYLVGNKNRWFLMKDVELQPLTIVTMDQEICWRLFTKGISKDQAFVQTIIEGDQTLGKKLLETVSIIA
jgi:uncharacterized protein (TIGR03083 family)